MENILLALYKSMVLAHLDYCVQNWLPRFRGDIAELEGDSEEGEANDQGKFSK